MKLKKDTICVQGGWQPEERRTESTADLSEHYVPL